LLLILYSPDGDEPIKTSKLVVKTLPVMQSNSHNSSSSGEEEEEDEGLSLPTPEGMDVLSAPKVMPWLPSFITSVVQQ